MFAALLCHLIPHQSLFDQRQFYFIFYFSFFQYVNLWSVLWVLLLINKLMIIVICHAKETCSTVLLSPPDQLWVSCPALGSYVSLMETVSPPAGSVMERPTAPRDKMKPTAVSTVKHLTRNVPE